MSNFLISPELFLAVKQGTYKIAESPSMKSGSIKHKMILEGDSFGDDYYIQEEILSAKQREFVDAIIALRKEIPFSGDADYNEIHKKVYSISKDGDGADLAKKLWTRIESEERGKKAITGAEWADARKALDIVAKNQSARALLNFADIRENEVYFKYRGLPCRAKIDGCGTTYEEAKTGIIVDLKTHSRPVSQEEFLKRIEEFGIKRQLAFYELALKNAEGFKDVFNGLERIRKIIISVDPVVARIYEVSDETAAKEVEKIDAILDQIKLMLTTDNKKKISDSWILV